VDETTLSLDPPLRACWSKIGQQKRVPATQPGSKQRRHIFAGYHWQTDCVTWSTALTKNTAAFIAFLEELLVKRYPTQRLVLVMDNVSYHKSAAALAAISLFEERVAVIWLPPYCSDLNSIERFWRFVKEQACANHLEDQIEAVLASAEKILTRQNDSTADIRFHVSKNL
jgi:transposase